LSLVETVQQGLDLIDLAIEKLVNGGQLESESTQVDLEDLAIPV